MMPNLQVDAKRRAAQFSAAQDQVFCLTQAKYWINNKINAQLTIVQQAAEKNLHLNAHVETLQNILKNITGCPDLNSLRGHEGAASAHYFTAWQHILPASLNFKGRNRRPPRDPFNTVLSLGYTLLHFEIVRRIYLLGLDPFVGFFHTVTHSRESLASDLLEPLRPEYDQWAAECFHQKILRPEDFTQKQEACQMGKAARIRFYGAFEHFLQHIRPELLQASRRLLAELGRHSRQDSADFDYTETHCEQTQ